MNWTPPYTDVEFIDRGDFADVFKADLNETTVALKARRKGTLKWASSFAKVKVNTIDDLEDGFDEYERLRRATLVTTGIPQAVDFFNVTGLAKDLALPGLGHYAGIMAMEFIEGETLWNTPQISRSFFPELHQIVDDLHYHGLKLIKDLNGGNVIVADERPKVIDWQYWKQTSPDYHGLSLCHRRVHKLRKGYEKYFKDVPGGCYHD